MIVDYSFRNLPAARQDEITGHKNVVYVQVQNVGSFQPGFLPAGIQGDMLISDLVFRGTHPRFGTFGEGCHQDDIEFLSARPGLLVHRFMVIPRWGQVLDYLDILD